MTAVHPVVRLSSLMSLDLPQTIAPKSLAEAGACIEGQIDLGKMTRLAEMLSEDRALVVLKLAFSLTGDGVTCITGSYETNLQLVCQRCLEPFAVKLANAINVGIAFEGVALKKIPASLEPLLLKQETMMLAEFIEDEILLGLPISPMHRLKDCAAGETAFEHHPVRSSPFQVLKKLKSG